MKFDAEKIDLAAGRAGIQTRAALAAKLGCTASNLSNILRRGQCRTNTLIKIAEAIGVDVETLTPNKP